MARRTVAELERRVQSLREELAQAEERASWNPRVLCWARFYGLDPVAATGRDERGDVRMLPDPERPGKHTLWTVLFSQWIRARWREWAESLGYSCSRDGHAAHEVAMLNGHTAEDFDAWLEERSAREEAARP